MGYAFQCERLGRGFSIPGFEMVDVREVLRLGLGDDPVVQMHKFDSNDGWRVTPDECREIARILGGRAGELLVRDYTTFVDGVSDRLLGNIRELAEFSAAAADHGGFRVD